MLKERLRQALIDQAQTGNLMTYKELGGRLGLEPPQTIHLIGKALETLMEDDVAAGRPMLVAPCVSKMRPGISRLRVLLGGPGSGGLFGRSDGPGGACLPRDQCSVCFLSMEASVRIWCQLLRKAATEIRGILQVQQKTMSFFARLKTGSVRRVAHLHRAPVPT